MPPLSDPERATDAASGKEDVGDALVEPGGRHRAVQALERLGAIALPLDEGEDRLGVDGHIRLRPLEAVVGEDLLVVGDDAVVDPDDASVPDGVVVGREGGVALGVIPYVHELLSRGVGDAHGVN